MFVKALQRDQCVGNYVLCAYADTSVWFSQDPGGDNGCLGCLSQGAYARVGSRGENDRSEDLMLRVKTA